MKIVARLAFEGLAIFELSPNLNLVAIARFLSQQIKNRNTIVLHLRLRNHDQRQRAAANCGRADNVRLRCVAGHNHRVRIVHRKVENRCVGRGNLALESQCSGKNTLTSTPSTAHHPPISALDFPRLVADFDNNDFDGCQARLGYAAVENANPGST